MKTALNRLEMASKGSKGATYGDLRASKLAVARSELLGGLAPDVSDVRVLDYERLQLEAAAAAAGARRP